MSLFRSPLARRIRSMIVAVAGLCAMTGADAASTRRGEAPAQPAFAAGGAEAAPLEGIVAMHNQARRAVGVGDLQWSGQLARSAQLWADRLHRKGCDMVHSDGSEVGENLAWASGVRLRPSEMVQLWLDEAADYDARRNRCRGDAECGHYTQMVWAGTRMVGCGKATCDDSEVWVCQYSPPGNYDGQRPY